MKARKRLRKTVRRLRRLRQAKPLRSHEHPVRVVFQCLHGGESKIHAERFEKFLKGKGMAGVFNVEVIGMDELFEQKGKEWREKMKQADSLVTLVPMDAYRYYDFKIPKSMKVYSIGEYWDRHRQPGTKFEDIDRIMFDDLLKGVLARFRLEN